MAEFGDAPVKTVHTKCTDTDIESKPLLKRINWLHAYIICVPPLIALVGLFTIKIRLPTVLLAIAFYYATGLGITAGYHRLWSHKSYKASYPVQFFLAVFAAAAFQGSARWWCRNHRAHHRYVDTPKDPYNAKRGFFYSHVGWMLVKQNPNRIGRVDISDLSFANNPLLAFQHAHYLKIGLTVSFLLPTLIASLWGDALGGLFFAGFLRLVIVHHATFFVNSLAHTVPLGRQPYTDEHTACDSFVTAILTLGEGYHNFHHTYPNDFRNGIAFYHYDPTKWLITALSWVGLTSELNTFNANMINKSVLQQKQSKLTKQLDQLDSKISRSIKNYKGDITMEELRERVKRGGEQLMAVDGNVIEVSEWFDKHPGGKDILKSYVGKDASDAFSGAIYKHSRSAHNILKAMTIGKVIETKGIGKLMAN